MKYSNNYSFCILTLALLLAISSCKQNTKGEQEEQPTIGIIVPQSGNAEVLGRHSKQGVELAIKKINSNGGLNGTQIKVIDEDSKAEKKEGINIIKNWVSKKEKPFLVYSVISGVSKQISYTTDKHKILLLSAVGAEEFIPNSKYSIRNYIPADTIARKIGEYSKTILNANSISIFSANTDYSRSVQKSLVSTCKRLNLDVQFEELYDETKHDYKSLVAAKVNKETELIFVDGIGTGLGTLIKQIRQRGYKGKIISTLLALDPDVKTAAGNSLKDLYYLDFAYDLKTSDSVQTFYEEYIAEYEEEPTSWAIIGFDGMQLVLETIRMNKTNDPDKLIKIFESIENFEGLYSNIDVKNREFQYHLTVKQYE